MYDDPSDPAFGIAASVESFLLSVREVAASKDPDHIPLLLLQVSQLLLTGGRLGALADVEREERFEPDAGYDLDPDEVRLSLARLLEPVDEYTEVFNPYDRPPELVESRLSDDLASVMQDLAHGLSHYKAGRRSEALWWWQHSYLSNWGALASACLRALQAVVLSAKLDTVPGAGELVETEDYLLSETSVDAVNARN